MKKTPRLPLLIAFVVLGAACGGGVSVDEAEELLIEQARAGGLSDAAADCVATEALRQYEPDELIGGDGDEASDEVAESIASITRDCLAADAPTSTTAVSSSTSAAPTTAPTTTPVTTAPPVDAGALDIFCRSSYDVAVASLATTLIDDTDPAALERYWTEHELRAEIALATAPGDDLTAEPAAYLETISAMHDAYRSIGYDTSAAFPNDVPIDELTSTFGTQTEGLRDFLIAQCGETVDLAMLDADAAQLADDLQSGEPAPVPTETTEPIIDLDTRQVVDDETSISIDVPATWVEQRSILDGEVRQLIISPDVERFENSWSVDGVLLTVVDEAIDFEGLEESSAAFEDCTYDSDHPYDYGSYAGTVFHYEECPGGTSAIVALLHDNDDTHLIAVEIQLQEFDAAVEFLLLDTVDGSS